MNALRLPPPGRHGRGVLPAARPVEPPAPAVDVGMRWLYLLALIPTLTDLIERGFALPAAPIQWLTEVVVGLVMLVLVHRMRGEYRKALQMARCDALTGLLNRRMFDESLRDECTRARRFGQRVSLAYIDLDGFKQINDQLGHKEGDRVLQQLAAVIQCTVRSRVDRAFRVGGDEFALLLPGSDTRHAQAVVARIRDAFEGPAPVPGGQRRGLSAGVVELRPGETAADLVQRADLEMYRQKRLRRHTSPPAGHALRVVAPGGSPSAGELAASHPTQPA